MEQFYIGIMSGNSLDAVDLVLTTFPEGNIKVHAAKSYDIPVNLKEKVLSLTPSSPLSDMLELDYSFAKLFANSVNYFIAEVGISREQIIAIGSHGQTILHGPSYKYPHSCQIGDPNIIAIDTCIRTVADFRRKDIALGGQGAPLAPLFHKYAFKQLGKDTVVINIGGIANITYLDKNGDINAGFDTGPGNILLDMCAERYFNQDFDINGAIAREAKCIDQLLEKMLQDEYFLAPYPKSTGRDYFNSSWLERHKLALYEPDNVICTLTHLTARSIAEAVKKVISKGDIVLCGGGSLNLFLFELVQFYCDDFQVVSSKMLGLNPSFVEASLFAYLAKLHVDNECVDMSMITGADKPYQIGVSFSPATNAN